MMALEWGDVSLRKRQLCVQRSDWKGHVTTAKGVRLRHVPMTARLAAALHDVALHAPEPSGDRQRDRPLESAGIDSGRGDIVETPARNGVRRISSR